MKGCFYNSPSHGKKPLINPMLMVIKVGRISIKTEAIPGLKKYFNVNKS
jgi:hypothetical protein